jgi:hypothetical protein
MKFYVHIFDRQLRPDESRSTPASRLALYIEVMFTLPRKTWFLDCQNYTRRINYKEFYYKFRVFCMLLLENLERILDEIIHLVNVTRDLYNWCNSLK